MTFLSLTVKLSWHYMRLICKLQVYLSANFPLQKKLGLLLFSPESIFVLA